MKKNIIAFILLWGLATPLVVSAIDLGGDLAAGAAREAGYDPGTTETTFAETLGTVVKTALSLVGVIFLSLMVYAGYLWMTARGEEAQIEKAQKMIRGAIIGLIITVGAHSITSFVVPRIVERTAGSAQQGSSTGGGATGGGAGQRLCTWDGGSAQGLTNQTACFVQCTPIGMRQINCRYDEGTDVCSWNSGQATNVASRADCESNWCASAARGAINCRWIP